MPAPLLIPIALELAKLAAAPVSRWLFGEKAGEVAERVVDTATMLVGGGKPEEVLARYAASEELRAKLQISLATLDGDLERAYLADIADARKRDVAIQSTGKRNIRADIMVVVAALGMLCTLVAAVHLASIGKFTADMAVLLTGSFTLFGNCLYSAFNFEFGSSRSSKEHSATIANIAKNGQG